MDSTDILIIGAGQAGLAAAYEAKRAGRRAVVLEAGDGPTGSWPHHYESLTLFSPARYSSLPGLPFPGDPERYPTRDEVVDYLAAYADWLDADIRYGERVDAVRAARRGGFTVVTDDGTELSAAAVVAATGGFGTPHRPPLPGLDSFRGTVLHSSEYDEPGRFDGARVIVVGAGNSAVQIAAEVAERADVTLATRAPVRWWRQRPLGRDVHWWFRVTGFDTAPLSRWLPRIGVAVLDHGAYRAAVAAGRPDRREMFQLLDGRDVVWSDGSRERVDALILATGFRPSLGYLAGTPALAADGTPLHRGGVSTTMPGLGYVGLEFQRSFSSSTLRGVGRDARYVVRRLARSAQPVPRPRVAA